jgi:Clp amino terminal domain, pathogenicity island component
MFNLEQSIAEWRRQMWAAGLKSPAHLDELECHLRDDIEQEIRTGADEATAFETAVQRIGRPGPLGKEFMKTNHFKRPLWQKLKAFILGARSTSISAMDNFEPAALQTLQLAPDQARHFNHDFVGTEHILLALTRSSSQALRNVMQKLGVREEILRQEIERFVPTGPIVVTASKIPYTPRARKSLRLAAEEAKNLRQPCVRAEHIFLGLLREGSGVAAIVLKNLGVRLETARAEILKEIDAHPDAGCA